MLEKLTEKPVQVFFYLSFMAAGFSKLQAFSSVLQRHSGKGPHSESTCGSGWAVKWASKSWSSMCLDGRGQVEGINSHRTK